MQQPPQASQMAMPNPDQNQYQQQQPPAQGMYQPQPGPTQPNNFAAQQPFPSQMNASGAPPSPLVPQQPQMQQPTFQPQQAQHPQMPNTQQQTPPTNVQFAPPLPQGQQPAATPFNHGDGEPSTAGGGGKFQKGSGRMKLKLPIKDKNLWMSGQSVVGRKGKNGEFMEVNCSVM